MQTLVKRLTRVATATAALLCAAPSAYAEYQPVRGEPVTFLTEGGCVDVGRDPLPYVYFESNSKCGPGHDELR